MDRSEAETSEAFMVVLEPGEAPPLHQHDDTEQLFYVVRGTGRLHIGADEDRQFPVVAGDLVRIPRGTPHRIQCQGGEPLVYLSVDCFVGDRPSVSIAMTRPADADVFSPVGLCAAGGAVIYE